jgi:hypothetical protein
MSIVVIVNWSGQYIENIQEVEMLTKKGYITNAFKTALTTALADNKLFSDGRITFQEKP